MKREYAGRAVVHRLIGGYLAGNATVSGPGCAARRCVDLAKVNREWRRKLKQHPHLITYHPDQER